MIQLDQVRKQLESHSKTLVTPSEKCVRNGFLITLGTDAGFRCCISGLIERNTQALGSHCGGFIVHRLCSRAVLLDDLFTFDSCKKVGIIK